MTAFISIMFGLFIFCGITTLFYKRGTAKDRVNKRLTGISGIQKAAVVDEDMDKPLKERLLMPVIKSATNTLSRIVPDDSESARSEELKKTLRQAGIRMSPKEYNVIRIIAIVATAAVFLLVGIFSKVSLMIKILLPLIGAYTAFAVMRFNLAKKVTKRRELMESQMPDVFDMLSVNVEAGLGFEQALLHIINNFEGPLVDELTITSREMSMGRSRREALQLLGTRCDIDDMKTFTGAVIQAGKLGISLKNVLRTQADGIRQNRRSKIREKAMKISVKMLLPMVAFIFPVIFIMLMGPAAIKILDMFGGM
jgi:tight adherence protein C